MDAMGILQIYKQDENRALPFCRCRQQERNLRQPTCKCGENDGSLGAWTWDTSIAHPETKIINELVVFHPVYSQGTSMIRGTVPLEKQSIHYWEIKMLTHLHGTDLMVGIGTDKVNLQEFQYKFASALGLNDESWGYSYRGLVQNHGRLKYYGKRYVQGCIVSVYLDLFKGHLEFYLNRRPLSIAYRNIPINEETPIYPMVCSTSARSSVKLINTTSFRECLQFRCMRVISKYPKMVEQIHKMPGLRQLCKDLWFLQCKEQYQYNDFKKNNLLLEDEAIICGIKHKRHKTQIESSSSNDSSSEFDLPDDIYNDMYRIKHTEKSEADSSVDDDDDILW